MALWTNWLCRNSFKVEVMGSIPIGVTKHFKEIILNSSSFDSIFNL